MIADHRALRELSSLPYFLLLQSIRRGVRKNPQCCSKRVCDVELGIVFYLPWGERAFTSSQSHVSSCYSCRHASVSLPMTSKIKILEKIIYYCSVAHSKT